MWRPTQGPVPGGRVSRLCSFLASDLPAGVKGQHAGRLVMGYGPMNHSWKLHLQPASLAFLKIIVSS